MSYARIEIKASQVAKIIQLSYTPLDVEDKIIYNIPE